MAGACAADGDCCEHPNATGVACEFANGANRCCGQAGSACGPAAGPDVICCPGLECECLGFACLCA